MLDAIVAFVVMLLVASGVVVILGPRNVLRRIAGLRRPRVDGAVTEPRRAREAMPPTLNPRTQRVVVAAGRLANWMRAHGH
jgi:hypothetical protein